jgi:uncharacterized protein (TIGR03067 family)
MNGIKSCLLIGLVLFGVTGCGRKAGESKSAGGLEGHWIAAQAGQQGGNYKVTIDGNRLDYRGANSNDWCIATFALNEQVQPPQIDLTIREMGDAHYVGKIALGIYQLQDDQLIVAAGEPGSTERPTSLSGGPNIRTLSLKRE